MTPAGTQPVNSADTGALRKRGFPAECPDISASFDLINQATYQVFAEQVFTNAEGQASLAHVGLGTAWAASDHLLVTNAHVAASFIDAAARGVQLSRAIAVQSGTGTVIRLTKGFIHPDYVAGLSTPDVAVFESEQVLSTFLPLAPADSILALGDEVQIVGFPGDVDMALAVVPGQTVPQATSLSGRITARRSFDQTEAVTPETLSIYQHQAPTSPGSSGSSIFHCGLVAGVNNAGTVRLVLSPDPTGGSFIVDRQPAASNNFGIHVRYIRETIDFLTTGTAGVFDLPVPAAPVMGIPTPAPSGLIPTGPPPPSQPLPTDAVPSSQVSIVDFGFEPGERVIAPGQSVTWTNTGQVQHTVTAEEVEFDSGPLDPGTSVSATFETPGVFRYFCAIHPQMRGTVNVAVDGGQASPGAPTVAGSYAASIDAEAAASHSFAFTVDENGNIQGTSTWPSTGQFSLVGAVNADGTFQLTDDAPERLGYRRGIYQGTIAADGTVTGVYFEQTLEGTSWPFNGGRDV